MSMVEGNRCKQEFQGSGSWVDDPRVATRTANRERGRFSSFAREVSSH